MKTEESEFKKSRKAKKEKETLSGSGSIKNALQSPTDAHINTHSRSPFSPFTSKEKPTIAVVLPISFQIQSHKIR